MLFYDSAWPLASPPKTDGVCIYSAGDTPHPWTPAEIAAQPATWRLPIFVRSNPWQCDPVHDAGTMIAWLKANGCPKGVATALDLETAIDAAYVLSYGSYLHIAGYLVLPYGSMSTLFNNPILDGYWVSNPTGTDHIVTGTVATQFAFDGSFDLDDVSNVVPLWNKNGQPSVPSNPRPAKGLNIVNVVQPPVAILACPSGGYWIVCKDGGVDSFGGAPFYGSLGGQTLAAPIVGASVSPSGKGYWLVGADGGVFAFGDAKYAGRVSVG